MGWISVNVNAEIDTDDFEDYQIIEIVEERINDLSKRTDPKGLSRKQEFIKGLSELLYDFPEYLSDSKETLHDKIYQELLLVIKEKFTIEELHNLIAEK